MAQVMAAPQKQKSSLLPLAGTLIGAAYGGPAGASAGGAIGRAIGGADAQPAATSIVENSAMTRRANSIQQNPSMQLAQADAALAQLPAEYQQAYGPTIKQARTMDSQSRGIA